MCLDMFTQATRRTYELQKTTCTNVHDSLRSKQIAVCVSKEHQRTPMFNVKLAIKKKWEAIATGVQIGFKFASDLEAWRFRFMWTKCRSPSRDTKE